MSCHGKPDPWLAETSTLPGAGPHLCGLLGRMGCRTVRDLLFLCPTGVVDRRQLARIADAIPGGTVTLTLSVVSHRTGRHSSQMLCRDESGTVRLVFFGRAGRSLRQRFPPGARIAASGVITEHGGSPRLVHPELVPAGDLDRLAVLEPVYPLTRGLSPGALRRLVLAALRQIPGQLPDWLPAGERARRDWPDFAGALARLHMPQEAGDISPDGKIRQRLAHDEFLAGQIALRLLRRNSRERGGRCMPPAPALVARATAALPFALTGSQIRVLGEISADMAQPGQMVRLLQGDVGAGKTLVAFLAGLNAIGNGAQVILMAPTAVLVSQHDATLAPLFGRLGIAHTTLTGQDRGRVRTQKRQAIARGDVQWITGTHALLQEGVTFHDPGLVIIDEQHRFGVDQRLALASRTGAAGSADVLMMSATPIPRSLALACHGDTDVSVLDEKPPGRRDIDTRLIDINRLDEVAAAVGRRLSGGENVYWICPLVEESEKADLASATARKTWLESLFPGRVGLVHGRISQAEKDGAIHAFRTMARPVLVATTVIEVGLDCRDASLIIVEHAERFGLAQLHQLRGRAGRGEKASLCLLLFDPAGLTDSGRQRLEVLRETGNGFVIAEADLRLRGPGEATGSRQSGHPDFRFGDLYRHAGLLADAGWLAREVDLEEVLGEDGSPWRLLLRLFDQERVLALFRGGTA